MNNGVSILLIGSDNNPQSGYHLGNRSVWQKMFMEKIHKKSFGM